MRRLPVTLTFLASACNNAPIDYRDVGTAPDADAAWMAPSNGCPGSAEPEIIDGFTLCVPDIIPIIPVDDPILRPCGDAEVATRLAPLAQVAWLHDGQAARAYALDALVGREGVHDILRGIPIFVDF